MNYKNLHIIISFIIFALTTVLSSPVINEDSINESSTEEEIIGEDSIVEILSGEETVEIIENPEIIKNPEIIDNKNIIENPDVTEIPDITEIPEVTENQNEEICDTPECQDLANQILNNVNLEVDPCNDFYEFTCGNYMKNGGNTNSMPTSGTLNIIYENLDKLIKGIEDGYKVNENLTPEEQEYDQKNFEKVANFYNSCIDIETINSKGIQPMLDLFTKLNVDEIKNKNNTVENLTNLLVKFDNYDMNILFNVNVERNYHNSNLNSIFIKQPSFDQDFKPRHLNPTYAISYKNMMKTMFTKIYQNQKEEDIENMVESVFEFEKKLIDISVTEDYYTIYYNNFNNDLISSKYFVNTNIKSLNENYPFINWKYYFNKRFEDSGIDNTVDDDTLIIDVTPQYLEKLNNIVKETDIETIATYAEWAVILKHSNFLSGEIFEIFKDYYTFIGIPYPFIPRSLICTYILFSKNMIMGANKVFAENALSGDSKKIAESIIENLMETMKKRISEISWFDETTRKSALKKASNLISEIGYPDFIMKPKELYQYYEGLEINSNELIDNILKSNQYEASRNLNRLGKEIYKTLWDFDPIFNYNGYYESRNKFVIFAGMLQKPTFSSSYPSYINYSNIGSSSGHELTHAFDSTFKNFDYDGNLNKWWTNTTEDQFSHLTQCFIDQYNEYYIMDSKGEKHYIDGENTLNENIADNGGVSRGFEAWKLSLEKDPEAKENNKKLPGLSQFTNEQMYFISFGQARCMDLTQDDLMNFFYSNEHPPDKFRLIGPIVNNKYFAEAFGCPINSPMNPKDKCKIW